MVFWSWCRVDWRQKLSYSAHLQLTAAGRNATPHCRSALSLTAHNLHFLLLMHQLWISCYSSGLHPEESWAGWWTGTPQKDPKPDWFACLWPWVCPVPRRAGERSILGGMIHRHPVLFLNVLRCRSAWIFPDCSPSLTSVLFHALTRPSLRILEIVAAVVVDCCRFIFTAPWSRRGLDGEGEKQREHQQLQPGRNPLCYFKPLEHRCQLSFTTWEPLGFTLVQIFTHLCVWQCFSSTTASQPLRVLIQRLTGVVAPSIHFFRITDCVCVCVELLQQPIFSQLKSMLSSQPSQTLLKLFSLIDSFSLAAGLM